MKKNETLLQGAKNIGEYMSNVLTEDDVNMTLMELLDSLPPFKNERILTSFIKAYSIVNDRGYNSILCSISGGSDSDVMLDIIYKVDLNKKVKYVWFDTGLEYQATKDHLNYLEKKYNINIMRQKAIKPIPTTCKEFGQPFLNKTVSEFLQRLQKYDFKFENEPYEKLIKKYPKCKAALKWWTSEYSKENNFKNPSTFDINYNKYLKEFILLNPPTFKISNKCCKYAKKDVANRIYKEYECDLAITGIRQSEGGIRSTMYKNCYTTNSDDIDTYRPIFWFTDEDKQYYTQIFQIHHSDCYCKWGFKRTGCVGCPYNLKLWEDLTKVKQFEPNMYKAVNNIFKDSYEYTRKYREFCELMKSRKV